MSKSIDYIKEQLSLYEKYSEEINSLDNLYKFNKIKENITKILNIPLLNVVLNTIEKIPGYETLEWCGIYSPEFYKVEFKHDGNTPSIDSEWFDNILKEVNFFESIYPKTQYGLILFLESRGIFLKQIKVEDGWMYYGLDSNITDCFTEDLTHYPDFNICVNTGIVECYCYLANKLKQN